MKARIGQPSKREPSWIVRPRDISPPRYLLGCVSQPVRFVSTKKRSWANRPARRSRSSRGLGQLHQLPDFNLLRREEQHPYEHLVISRSVFQRCLDRCAKGCSDNLVQYVSHGGP